MSSRIMQDIFLGRQPILDREQQLVAYELLFRSGSVNVANIVDDMAASATVLTHAFGELGIEQALGPYRGFINADARLLFSDVLEVLPRERIVLEVLEHVEVTPDLVARCRDLRKMGFTLALDDFIGREHVYADLLELVEIVKVDLLSLDAQQLLVTTRALERYGVTLLAEKVDSQQQARHCLELGYQLFQGYFFARPTIVQGKKLSTSELTVMRVLNLLMSDAETGVLEDALKREPGLTLNLMRLSNSVASGLRQKVSSLRHAITVLGRRQLQRWMQLMLFTNPAGGGTSSPLLQLAATRGRLMELLATDTSTDTRMGDQAFLAGIISLMPALLGMPIEEILGSIEVEPDIRAALLEHRGPLGTLLHTAEWIDGQMSHGRLPAALSTRLMQAMSWANSIAQEGAIDAEAN